MKVKAKTVEETIVGAEKEMNFEIDTDSHIIFEILRDKMYSDKIGAVAREIASNSRDANREAGRPNEPVIIEIVKPNKFASIGHQSIVFHDNGIGITPDRMADVFIKYASSTKRDSNKETGGFGLGAKTPFAYSDTFTVVTVCDYEGKRIKYTYNAIIDESNKGKMILFDQEETTENTGTKIVVPIKNDEDRRKFEDKAVHATEFWGNKVEYRGFNRDIKDITFVIEEKKFSLVKRQSESNYALLIDGIHYPLSTYEVGINDSGVGNAYTILLKFNTGQLTISANREAVQYDEQTVKLIKERLEHIKDRISALANEYVETLPTYYDACKFAYYMLNAKPSKREEIQDDYLRTIIEAFNANGNYYYDKTILSEDRDRFKTISFGGKEIKSHLEFKYHRVAAVKEPRYGNKTDYSSFTKLNITEKLKTMPIYYADARKDKRRNETIWDNENKAFFFFMPSGGTPKEQLDEMNNFVTEFDLDFKLYSEVEKKKTSRDYVPKSDFDKENVCVSYKRYDGSGDFSSWSFNLNRKTKQFTDSDKDFKNYYYYMVHRMGDLQFLPQATIQKALLVEEMTNKKVIFVNEISYRNWISKTPIKSLEKEYAKLEKKWKKKWEEQTRNKLIQDTFHSAVGSNMRFFHKLSNEIKPILPKCVQEVFVFNDSGEVETDNAYFVKQTIKFNKKGLETKLKTIFDEKYPMLMPYLNDQMGGWYRKPNMEVVKKVVNEYLKDK